jgi:hypothetical protein
MKPAEAEEPQEGPQVGADDSDRLGPEMDLGTDEVREVFGPERSQILHLVRLQEVEETRQVTCAAAQGPGCAVEVMPAEALIVVEQGLQGRRQDHFWHGVASSLVAAVEMELGQDAQDSPDESLSRTESWRNTLGRDAPAGQEAGD